MHELGTRRAIVEFDPESLEGRIWARWMRALDQLEAGEFECHAERGATAGGAVRMSLVELAKLAAEETRLGF